MNPKVSLWTERLIGAFKYLVAGYMMLAGVLTPFATDASTTLGWIYGNPYSLAVLGLLVFVSGAILLYGKVRRSKRWTGRGLFYCCACFLFAAILNAVAYVGDPTYWVGNAVAALVMAALWLRWKLKQVYVSPNHFRSPVV